MTNVCDCVTPTTTRCDCHATEHEFHDPRPEDEQPPKSLYDIPTGCICQGDGLMGMECHAAEHARLRVDLKEPELKDPRDERIRELVIALNETHAGYLKE